MIYSSLDCKTDCSHFSVCALVNAHRSTYFIKIFHWSIRLANHECILISFVSLLSVICHKTRNTRLFSSLKQKKTLHWQFYWERGRLVRTRALIQDKSWHYRTPTFGIHVVRQPIPCGSRSHDGQRYRVCRAQCQPQLLLCITRRQGPKKNETNGSESLMNLEWVSISVSLEIGCRTKTWKKTLSHVVGPFGWPSLGGRLQTCSVERHLWKSHVRRPQHKALSTET